MVDSLADRTLGNAPSLSFSLSCTYVPFSVLCSLLGIIWFLSGCSFSCVLVDLGGDDDEAADKSSQLSWPSCCEKWSQTEEEKSRAVANNQPALLLLLLLLLPYLIFVIFFTPTHFEA